MVEVAAREVKALRDATGAGMMDAKRALVDANGDHEAAAQALREQGLAKAVGRSDRDNAEGAIGLATTTDRAALVHLRCETDFSAKSEGVVSLWTTLHPQYSRRARGHRRSGLWPSTTSGCP